VSPAGRVLASARVDGACRLRLHIPDHLSSGTLRLRLTAANFHWFRLRVFDAPRIRSEVGSSAKVAGRSTLAQGTQSVRESTVLVRSAEPRTVQLAIRPGPDSSLETLEVSLADSAGNVVFRGGNRLPPASGNRARLSTSSHSTWVSNCRTAPLVGSAPRTPMPTVNGSIGQATACRLDCLSASATSGAAHIPNAAYLHTDCVPATSSCCRATIGLPSVGTRSFQSGPCISTRCSATQPTMPVSAKGFARTDAHLPYGTPFGCRLTPEGEEERVARIEAKA